MLQVTAPLLARQPFLRGLRPEQLDTLAATASEVMFPAGHRIFAADGSLGHCWLIESGYVHLDVLVPGEPPVVLGTVGAGGALGWSWLTAAHRRSSGAVCVTEVRAIQFNASAVRGRCAADPALAAELTARSVPRPRRTAARYPGHAGHALAGAG